VKFGFCVMDNVDRDRDIQPLETGLRSGWVADRQRCSPEICKYEPFRQADNTRGGSCTAHSGFVGNRITPVHGPAMADAEPDSRGDGYPGIGTATRRSVPWAMKPMRIARSGNICGSWPECWMVKWWIYASRDARGPVQDAASQTAFMIYATENSQL